MAFWGIEIKAGKPFTLAPDKTCGRLRITQATLGFGSSNKSSSIQCNVGKKTPVLLCSLLPDKAESIHLDLEFDEAEEVAFSVVGPRSVHLTGYFLGSTRRGLPGDDESESFGEDIRDTDTEISDGFTDEDEYEGSFIDDGEPKVSESPSEEEGKRKANKKKAGARKSSHKRLRKMYELSASEDEDVTSSQNTAHDPIREQIVESDQDDKKPISSLRNAKTNDEDSKRKPDAATEQATDGNQSEDKKVKKKNKKRKTDKKTDTSIDVEKPSEADSMMKSGRTKADCSRRTIAGGLVIEDLELGEQDAKVASKGKKVTIHYTGRLKEGGQVFASTVEKSPLKFRVGKDDDDAPDGLHLGTEGMRVGGRRRLLIPPALGYGSHGTEGVPPNSWLIMDVELVKVRK